MEIILEPHVASSMLDHYQGKVDKVKKIVGNCRGWLIGTTTSRTAMVTNFLPDTFNCPSAGMGGKKAAGKNVKSEEFKQYNVNLQQWLESVKSMFHGESTIIGIYAVGNGSAVDLTTAENGTESTMSVPYDFWSTEYTENPYFQKRGMAVFVDVNVPSKTSPTLDFNGACYRYVPTKQSEPIPVRIVPEAAGSNTMSQHIISEAYGETAEDTMVPALELDRILAELPEDANITNRIERIFASLENAVKGAKKDDPVSRLVAKLREERGAEGSGASGDVLGDDRTRNALMTKLVVARMQEVIQVLEQTVVKVNGARNKR